MFIGRTQELSQLERFYKSGRAELFILYGRRRVGKTELLRAFCEDKEHLFFIATLSNEREQLTSFSRQIWRYTHPSVPEGFTFPSWEAAFQALAGLPGRPIVILDEFTYLITGNKALPSILQKIWDETLKDTRIFLILCGSYIGMMESEVLGHRSALYGRRTGSHLLAPFELYEAARFFPHWASIQQIEAWAVLGGMPYYLCAFSDSESLFENIRSQILDGQGLLYDEPRLLLMEELREPSNYFSILRAVAQGKTRLNEITQSAGISSPTTTNRYLDILRQMRIVERQVPATESRPEKSKKGIYRITDPFLRFWFSYVHPHRGSLDLGLQDAILEQRVRPTFPNYMGLAFEEASRQYITRMARTGKLEFLPERIGAWWDRDTEIDLVAVSDADQALLLGECKWTEKPLGTNILVDLQRKALEIMKGSEWRHTYLALFSKSGFTPALELAASEQGVLLIRAEELVGEEE